MCSKKLWIQCVVRQKLGMILGNKEFQNYYFWLKKIQTNSDDLDIGNSLWKSDCGRPRLWHVLRNCHSLYSKNIVISFVYVDFWPKIMLFRRNQHHWNSATKMKLLYIFLIVWLSFSTNNISVLSITKTFISVPTGKYFCICSS